jgi:ethanolamine utilization microcompartment shell protein EutS
LDARTSLGDVTVTLAEDAFIGGDLFTAQGDVALHFPDTLPVSLKIARGLGGSLQVPSGLDQLVGGRWRTQGIIDDEVRADLNLSSRFGDIIVEYSN